MVHKLLLLFLYVCFSYAEPYASLELIDAVNTKYGKFGKNRFELMNREFASLKNRSTMEKLNAVNDFYNGVRYAKDINLYKVKDYWATPWEFLGHDKGDCEDYVIAKYFALRYLGIDSSKLYFSYVKSRRFKGAHMVLTYFKTPRSVPLVLDNNNLKIFPATKRKDLIPIYNFNGDSLFKAKKKGTLGKKVKAPKVHKKWDQLVQNIKNHKICKDTQ